jgi:transposase
MVKNDLRKVTRQSRDELHLRAIEAVVKYGQTSIEVAKAFGTVPQTINAWLRRYRAGGKKALISGKAKGSARALTSEEEETLVRTVLKKVPEDFGLVGMLWTREHCCSVAKVLFKKPISLSAMGRVLKRRNMSSQKPLRKAIEQNKKEVENWKQKVFPKILKEAKERRASVYFSDETGVRSDAQGGTTWGKKGRTPVVPKTGKRLKLNVIGAMSRRGDFRFMIYEKNLNSKKFIEFLKRLMHGRRRPVYLVVDSLRAHKSGEVMRYVKSLKGKLTLVFLPSYSPDLNPQEYGWNVLKGRRVGAARISGKNDLIKAVRSCLRTWQKNPKTIRGFFRSKHTIYAA